MPTVLTLLTNSTLPTDWFDPKVNVEVGAFASLITSPSSRFSKKPSSPHLSVCPRPGKLSPKFTTTPSAMPDAKPPDPLHLISESELPTRRPVRSSCSRSVPTLSRPKAAPPTVPFPSKTRRDESCTPTPSSASKVEPRIIVLPVYVFSALRRTTPPSPWMIRSAPSPSANGAPSYVAAELSAISSSKMISLPTLGAKVTSLPFIMKIAAPAPSPAAPWLLLEPPRATLFRKCALCLI